MHRFRLYSNPIMSLKPNIICLGVGLLLFILCSTGDYPVFGQDNPRLDTSGSTASNPRMRQRIQYCVDHQDGTVTDMRTQLMWAQEVPDMSFTQAQALEYCRKLTFGGHNDWRLPSREELEGIVDTTNWLGDGTVALDKNCFKLPPQPGRQCWSATLSGDDQAFSLDFVLAEAQKSNISEKHGVRAVRTGDPVKPTEE
ncbi:MAG: DUF1566 domain-containing protein [Deltaproteobacteria bacterium]|nr:DUF1566 domain-containing protein [Deltaproteobacteria bacterium]